MLANDGGTALTVTGFSDPPNGSLSCSPAGACQYYPSFNFNGTDSFTYTARDGNGAPATATVTVTVTEVNDPPGLGSDDAELPVGTPSLVVDVLANDGPGAENESSQELTVASISNPPDHGTATVIQSGADAGKVRYTPNAGFGGTDVLFYTACDDGTTDGAADQRCSQSSVTFRVRSRPPVAVDDSETTPEDTELEFNPLGNDTDPDGDALGLSISLHPQHGTIECAANGACTYVRATTTSVRIPSGTTSWTARESRTPARWSST